MVSAHDLALFRDKLLYLAKGASMCVFAGSLPRGVPPDIYAGLIRELKKQTVTTIKGPSIFGTNSRSVP